MPETDAMTWFPEDASELSRCTVVLQTPHGVMRALHSGDSTRRDDQAAAHRGVPSGPPSPIH